MQDESTPINLQSESIQSILSRFQNPNELTPRPTINAIESLLESFCLNYNLPSLASICTSLIVEEESINLEILFLFIEPKKILLPLRIFLDNIDTTQDRFGEGHAVEKYGFVAHFLLIVMSRFNVRLCFLLSPFSFYLLPSPYSLLDFFFFFFFYSYIKINPIT